MTRQEDDEKYVCHDCIGDDFLSKEVKTTGTSISCTYCSCIKESISLESLSDRVHGVIEEHFVRTPSEPDWIDSMLLREGAIAVWMPDGHQVENLIMDMMDVSEEIATEVTYTLHDRHIYRTAEYNEENPYASEAHYEESTPDDRGFRLSWEHFCNEIMYKERFFPQSAEPVLAALFGELNSLITSNMTPVIREVNPHDEDFPIWRARTAQSDEELRTILESPSSQIGPPPSSYAEVGRMNPRGVPVFYGAMDPETCIAEVRPPVGSHVVLGKFRLLRQVKLLDLGSLSKVFANYSYFDPEFGFKAAKAAFFRRLVSEINRPVMPRDVEREYLPTQFIASYLAHRVEPNLDGIIFPSSQTADDGQNIVLFNFARGVQPNSFPDESETTVYIDSPVDEEDDDRIVISETVPSADPEEDSDIQEEERVQTYTTDYDTIGERNNSVPATLELDIESIEVRVIKRVKFCTHSRPVTRHRQTTEERDSLERRISGIVSFDDLGEDF